MASYESAFTSKLGDVLNVEASKKGISRSELEKKCSIISLKVDGEALLFADPKESAIEKFDEKAKECDLVTDLTEGLKSVGMFGFIGQEYFINGTGVIYHK